MGNVLAALGGAALAGLAVGLWARRDLARLQVQGEALARTLEQQGGDAQGYLLGTGAGAIVDLTVYAATEADRVAQAQAVRTLADYGITPAFAARAQRVADYVR